MKDKEETELLDAYRIRSSANVSRDHRLNIRAGDETVDVEFTNGGREWRVSGEQAANCNTGTITISIHRKP